MIPDPKDPVWRAHNILVANDAARRPDRRPEGYTLSSGELIVQPIDPETREHCRWVIAGIIAGRGLPHDEATSRLRDILEALGLKEYTSAPRLAPSRTPKRPRGRCEVCGRGGLDLSRETGLLVAHASRKGQRSENNLCPGSHTTPLETVTKGAAA